MTNMKEFEEELRILINKNSLENQSNTPDFVIARFMMDAYYAFMKGVNRRSEWYDYAPGTGASQDD